MRPRLSLKGRLFLLLLCFAASYIGWYAGRYYSRISFEPQALQLRSPATPMAPFNLLDQFHQPADLSHLKGQWSILFPAASRHGGELQHLMGQLSRLHNRLAEQPSLQGSIRYVMVAMDATTDTPERFSTLLGGYSRSFMGLSGDHQQLEAFLQQPALTPAGSADHFVQGGRLLVINAKAEVIAEFTQPFDPVTIGNELKRLDELLR